MKFDTLKKVAVTLKIKSRSPKSNQLFTPSHHCIYASLVKICPLVQKITARNEISYITKRSLWPWKLSQGHQKYKQLFPSSQQCICASFIKICSLVQKIKSGNEISHPKKVAVTLKIKSRSPKSNPLHTLPTLYLCKFGQNMSTGSEDKARKRNFIHYKGRCNLEN